MRNYGSIEHGWDLARSYANQSAELFESLDFLQAETPVHPEEKLISEYHDQRFLKELINYVIYRNL